MTVKWMDRPEAHDYDAARDYLSLIMDGLSAVQLTAHLAGERSPRRRVVVHPAKDILRASGLPLLPKDNRHVRKDLDKIEAGEELSPVLLIRGDAFTGRPLIIADGYHRVCGAYIHDENTDIPAVMAWL